MMQCRLWRWSGVVQGMGGPLRGLCAGRVGRRHESARGAVRAGGGTGSASKSGGGGGAGAGGGGGLAGWRRGTGRPTIREVIGAAGAGNRLISAIELTVATVMRGVIRARQVKLCGAVNAAAVPGGVGTLRSSLQVAPT